MAWVGGLDTYGRICPRRSPTTDTLAFEGPQGRRPTAPTPRRYQTLILPPLLPSNPPDRELRPAVPFRRVRQANSPRFPRPPRYQHGLKPRRRLAIIAIL